MDLESQNVRDARIEALWGQLDPQHKGELDLSGLQKGLRRIDHPLKNASEMLEQVVKAMDKDGDKVIQYEEFRSFVEATENQLLLLFKSIDRDCNGKLDKSELQTAFKKAGLSVPTSKLNQFFEEIDGNNDGYISFDEWRNFLLFMPTHDPASGLKAVMSYYSSTVTLNAEGDTSISGDTLAGLGILKEFPNVLFGVILEIANPKPASNIANSTNISKNTTHSSMELEALALLKVDVAQENNSNPKHPLSPPSTHHPMAPSKPVSLRGNAKDTADSSKPNLKGEKSMLIQFLPDAGYFVAGGLAGVISRTATAPLDRLKVYLIASTESAKDSVAAAKKGDPVKALRHIGRPLVAASAELWKAGGMRSLFAGNGLNVIKVMPESAFKFGSYEAAKRILAKIEGHGEPQNIKPISKFLAGGLGGMGAQIIVYPLDTLKFRMQCEVVNGGLQGNALIIETAKKMIAQGGIKSAYRGLTMGLVGMFPYSAIDLGTFEYLKAKIARHNAKLLGCHEEDALPGAFATGCIGAVSGAVGASLVYPINLLRTRLQAQGTVLHQATYTGIVDVFRKTVQKEGTRGLFKGITPNLLKVVPSVSITYMVYESAKKTMNLR